MENFESYKIEKIQNSEVAYKLYGTRSKVINLIKNQNEEGLYFMVNAKTWEEEYINGFNWVKEINGTLKLVK